MQRLKSSSVGFTLIELITVIIILGVVSVGISGFIRTGMQIYGDVTERDQLLSESRFVVERLNRELRMAVPNSARLNLQSDVHCLEFVPAKWVTFYTSLPLLPDLSTTVNVVAFADNSEGFVLNTSTDYAVVYPTTSDDVYNTANNKRRTIAACIDGGANTSCSTDDDPNNLAQLSVNAAFEDSSPASRLYFVRDGEAVSYCVRDQKIYRHTDSINVSQTAYTSGGVLMAENLVNELGEADQQPFKVIEATLTRNGLVQTLLTFEKNDEVVNFNNEVHMPNVP
jgi:MSHA biogenesis protein MshO